MDGGEALVVTHAGLLRYLRGSLGGDGHRYPNLAGNWFVVDGERIILGEVVELIDPQQPVGDAL